jgi:hypothetical protein
MLSPSASRPWLLPGLLLALGAVLATLAGCGNGSSSKGNLLNARQATDLKGTLAQVEQSVATKNCTSAAQQAASFEQQIDSIQHLDRRLRSALRASSRRLQTLVADNCQSTPPPATQTTTTPTTGDTGPTGPQGKVKKQKNSGGEQAPKQNGNPTPPGQGGQPPPGHQDGGGGAGVPANPGGD